jgi:crotonobetainyl-CoA:carnitine CoA-transferase CaiB-like acyl-CoA transferase
VNGPDDLLDDPQVVAPGSLLAQAGSGARVLANPLRVGSATGEAASLGRGDPPALGEHTAEALEAAGFSAEEIAALQADQVVGG